VRLLAYQIVSLSRMETVTSAKKNIEKFRPFNLVNVSFCERACVE